MHFPGADRSVMVRTQRFKYELDGARPAQVGCYVLVSRDKLLTGFCCAKCSFIGDVWF